MSRITPTKGLNVANIPETGYNYRFWDVSGDPNYKSVWDSYFGDADYLLVCLSGLQQDF